MYSLNVPVPPAAERLAADLHPQLVAFDRIRERHSVVCKRFEADAADYDHLRERLRVALSPTPAFEARVTGIDTFETPTHGPGPVVYLAVESPGLWELHDRLCQVFEPVTRLEGADYTPHVTVARGGSLDAAKRLLGPVESLEWTVTELQFWDATQKLVAGRVSLPA